MIETLHNVPGWVWLVHALLYPVYQILGTFKHEAAHAIAAKKEGRGVEVFVFWPQRDLGYFTWGYVRYGYAVLPLPRYVMLMPYYVDAIWFALGVACLAAIDLADMDVFWVVGAFVVVVMLPAFDVIYNLAKWALKGTGDFADAFREEKP